MTIVSELLFSAGRSIFVLLSSRICHNGKNDKFISGVSCQNKALVICDIINEQERAASGIQLQAVTILRTRNRKDISPF